MTYWICTYLLAGVVFNFFYDVVIDRIGEAGESLRFTIPERIAILILWPIAAIKFLTGFLSQFNDDDNG